MCERTMKTTVKDKDLKENFSKESSDWKEAFCDSIPVMAGYIPIGMTFGFLAAQSGLPAWFVIASSVFVYAGASQFMMIPMAVAGFSIPAIAFATFVVNFRHAFYGIPVFDRLPKSGLKRWYCVFAITDETFSLVTTLPKEASKNRVFVLSFLNQVWWNIGTAVGVFAGLKVQLNLTGLDFVLTCLFAMLATEQWRHRKTSVSLWIALISFPIAWYVDSSEALLIAIACCTICGLIWGKGQVKEGENHV